LEFGIVVIVRYYGTCTFVCTPISWDGTSDKKDREKKIKKSIKRPGGTVDPDGKRRERLGSWKRRTKKLPIPRTQEPKNPTTGERKTALRFPGDWFWTILTPS
jgi:hypothetical protein